jgi:predicted DNA-binding mobile mystery protein A
MQTYQSIMRRQLDERFAGLGDLIDKRPMDGWIKTIRRALWMSGPELARRMSISSSRASRIERAEMDDSLQLSTLRQAAAALNCRLCYVLVPVEPLEDMVLRQANRRAEEELSLRLPVAPGPTASDGEIDDWLETRTLELVDHGGLWRQDPALDQEGPRTTDDVPIEGALPSLHRGRRSQGRPEADEVQP